MKHERTGPVSTTPRIIGGRLAACIRRATRRAGVLAVGVCLAAPGSALALQTHGFSQTIGSAGAGAGQVASPSAVAVNSATGDVYVADTGNARVDEFSATGTFIAAWGWGVADGASSFETCTTTCQAGIAGSGPGQFTSPTSIAVDNSSGPSAGDVYVADSGDNLITKFTSSGAVVSNWGDATPADGQLSGTGTSEGSFRGLEGITVSPAGDLWITTGNGEVVKYAEDGTFDPPESSLGRSAFADGIAVDTAGSSYVAVTAPNPFENRAYDYAVEKLSPSRTSFLGFVDGYPTPPGGVAVDPTTNDVYVEDGGQISHYTASCVPSFTVPCAANDRFGSGHLSSSAAGIAVNSATGTLYAADPGNNQIDVFTPETLPDVTSGQASSVTQTSATLTGTVNPDGIALTGCHFEYGTDTSYARGSVPCEDASGNSLVGSTSSSPAAVHADVTGLQAGMGYHFQLVASNAQGSTPGGDGFFPTTAPPFSIKAFSFSATDQNGDPYTQAGGHPYEVTANVQFPTATDQSGNPIPAENPKDLHVDLPAGLIANPDAAPKCSQNELFGGSNISNCPSDTQIGVISFTYEDVNGPTEAGPYPLYNLVAPDNTPAQFGFQIVGVPTFIDGAVRTGGDYGLSSTVSNITQAEPIIASTVTLWGDPADPSHDPERACPGSLPPVSNGISCSSSQAPTAFLTMPTSCPGTQLTATASADSWQTEGSFVTASSTMPATTGCGSLPFNPSITVQPDTGQADSPSGLSVDLQQSEDGLTDPSELAPADLKKVVVTLPQGVTVNPSAANGLAACTPAQIGIDNANEPSCPDASKIGSVEVDSPLLPDTLTGGVYIAQQNQNPFGSLLAIYVTAEADGALIKLAGHVVANPVTGQLQTTFDNNPQLPFTDFKLTFFGGPRGALATPASCGTFTTTSDLTPWSGGLDVTSSDPFTIGSGCMSGFSPSFTAGTQNPQAGRYSPFVLSFQRSDTDQEFSGLSVKLPPGMLAKLAGVQECTDAQLVQAAANSGTAELANASCPAGSQVGTVTTAAGPGSDSMIIGGKAYLTGPYKGAPYGFAVVVPAVAGPYDLGTVVVRQALYVDPTTAQVTAVSDPFPTILQGIPLDIRQIDVDLNRPDFTINPTSCNPMSVTGTLTSTGGLTYAGDARFQVGGCQDIGFSPKLKIALSGKGKTRSGDHPTLTATLTDPRGQANLRSAKVTLPLSMALDPNNSQHVCSYSVAAAVHGGAVGCPTKTIVGTATANTPLLSKPLTGKVYLVQGLRCAKGSISAQGTCPGGRTAIHTLPSLLVPLRGQIALDLRAKSSVNGAGALVTTFGTIPDAPVSKFTLQITGGKKGLLVVTGRGQSICGKPQIASENLGAQSGKSMVADDTLATPCTATKK